MKKQKDKRIGDIKIFKRICKWYNSKSSLWKNIMWLSIGIIILALIINSSMNLYFSVAEGKILDKKQCVQVGINTYNTITTLPTWERILFEYKQVISFLLVAVGIGWIFHGVGFRIIG